MSVLILVVLSGITISGTLGTVTDRRAMLGGQGRLLRFAQLFDWHSSSDDESEDTKESSRGRDDGTEDNEVEGLSSTETTLARWKAVEILKVIMRRSRIRLNIVA